MEKKLHDFILQLGDNALVLGHRLSEWCGHGPALEQDIALANIALDHVGQARMYYQLAASIEGNNKTEDSYPFERDIRGFKNVLLLEHENVDFAYTIARSFYYDYFHYLLLQQLCEIAYTPIAEIAAQAIKEVKYHNRYSGDWIRRLGDGTEESHIRIQKAIDDLYVFTGELFIPSEADLFMKENYNVDIVGFLPNWKSYITDVLLESTVKLPENTFAQKGGKTGIHTEKFGYLLAELQYMQRAYPNSTW